MADTARPPEPLTAEEEERLRGYIHKAQMFSAESAWWIERLLATLDAARAAPLVDLFYEGYKTGRSDTLLTGRDAPLTAEEFHDAWTERGMICAGTHALGEALCQNVTAALAALASGSDPDEPTRIDLPPGPPHASDELPGSY